MTANIKAMNLYRPSVWLDNHRIRFLSESERAMNSNELILFESRDKTVALPVQLQGDTVWLN